MIEIIFILCIISIFGSFPYKSLKSIYTSKLFSARERDLSCFTDSLPNTLGGNAEEAEYCTYRDYREIFMFYIKHRLLNRHFVIM